MRDSKIALISTGGTIEKTFDELEGVLHNEYSNLDVMLASLQLEGVSIVRVPLMNKDSLKMTPQDHKLTDRLAATGEKIVELLKTPRVPVILTGAIRPYMLRNSDAIQNLTEALLAVQIAAPGVYVAMHNRLLQFPGVTKDRRRGTFVCPGE
jgi:L-asparaginase